MKLFDRTDERIETLLDHAEESDWFIDDATEAKVRERMEHEEAALDVAARVKEIETGAAALKEWKRDADAKIRQMEGAAGKLRSALTWRLCMMEEQGAGRRIDDPKRGLKVYKVEGREKLYKQDEALEKKQHVTGYTENQIETCSIPRSFFKPTTVYTLDTELVMEYLKQGQKIPGVEIVQEPYVVIKVAS